MPLGYSFNADLKAKLFHSRMFPDLGEYDSYQCFVDIVTENGKKNYTKKKLNKKIDDFIKSGNFARKRIP